MLLTSVAIPPAATWHTAARRAGATGAPARGADVPDLVLFDRDGTLVHDVPYNGDPELVRPGRRRRARRSTGCVGSGSAVGVVTNQSGVAVGRLTAAQVDAVNARVEELLGPFDTLVLVPARARRTRCTCRKPAPGMVVDACAELGVDPSALRPRRRHRDRRGGGRGRGRRAASSCPPRRPARRTWPPRLDVASGSRLRPSTHLAGRW